MKQLTFGLICAAAVATMTLPAAAQVGVRIGDEGVGVRVGPRDRAEYRERNHFRDHEWREHRYTRDCNTFWRDGRRVRVCRED